MATEIRNIFKRPQICLNLRNRVVWRHLVIINLKTFLSPSEVGNTVNIKTEMQNFNICDINSDDKLSLDEFKGFLYPHYYDHTHVIHVANNIR